MTEDINRHMAEVAAAELKRRQALREKVIAFVETHYIFSEPKAVISREKVYRALLTELGLGRHWKRMVEIREIILDAFPVSLANRATYQFFRGMTDEEGLQDYLTKRAAFLEWQKAHIAEISRKRDAYHERRRVEKMVRLSGS